VRLALYVLLRIDPLSRSSHEHFAKFDDVIKLIGIANASVYAISLFQYVSEQLDVVRSSNKDGWHPG